MPISAAALTDLALARGHLDRSASRRSDLQLIGDLLSSPDTRVLGVRDGTVPVESVDGQPRLLLRPPRPEDAEALVCFLGEADRQHEGQDGARRTAYCAVVESGGAEVTGETWVTLRQVGARLGELDATLATTALAVTNWHATHRFCGRCGEPTEPALGGWVRRCVPDGSEHYPRTDPAVIMSVVDADDRILLARGAGFTSRGMSVLAGFVEPGESLAAAVAREVLEEVGIEVEDVTYLGDQPWPFPSSLMVGFTARALGTTIRVDEDEISAARWFTREELSAAVSSGEVAISSRVSIARRIIEHWFGGPIDAPEAVVRPV